MYRSSTTFISPKYIHEEYKESSDNEFSMIVFSLFREYGDKALYNANYLKVDNRHGRRRSDAVGIAGMWLVVSVE